MASKTTTFGRRSVLKGATATAALMGAVRASFPGGANKLFGWSQILPRAQIAIAGARRNPVSYAN